MRTLLGTGAGHRARYRALRAAASLPVTLAALLLGACTGDLFRSELPTPTVYSLDPAPPAASATGSAARETDLAVGWPDVAPGLDTPRIAVLRGQEVDYFRNARWSGSTAEIVQAALVATLQDQQLFRSVADEQARIAGHYLLDVEVRKFHAEYRDRGAPHVSVMLIGRVVRISDRRMVATLRAVSEHRADDNRLSEVVTAFESAMQEVAIELARSTARVVATDMQRSPERAISGTAAQF